MKAVCQECKNTKGTSHKYSCSRSSYRGNEVWVNSVTQVVLDASALAAMDTSHSHGHSYNHDHGSAYGHSHDTSSFTSHH